MRCEAIVNAFNHFNDVLQKLDGKILDDEELAFGIYKNINAKRRLRNYLTYTIRHITFTLRGVELNDTDIASQTIINKTLMFIRKDLGIIFLNALHKNKEEKFCETYLIEDIFGYIENGIVYVSV